MTDENQQVLDLFCGAGGLSRGFEVAGYDVMAGFDSDEAAVDTFRYNHPSVGLVEDLRALHPSDAPVAPRQVDGIIGGPPCQDFSVANYFSRGGEKTNLVFIFADWVEYMNPQFFVMENVVGIKSTGDVFAELLDAFPEDYTVGHATLDAANFGVPQTRQRVFIVGNKDADVSFPDGDEDSVTVGDVFEDLPRVEAGETDETLPNHRAPNHQQKTIERIESANQGESLYDSWTERIRLDPTEPAPTLKAGQRINYHFGHPWIPRGLTVRERARLQSFPDNFVFCGSLTDQRTQTGDAVPPLLAAAVAAAVP